MASSAALYSRMETLQGRVESLLERRLTCVHVTEKPRGYGCDCGKCAMCSERAWEPILAGFRVLTASMTAGARRLDADFVATVYERAADAALLGGGLPYFLACTSRLVGDVYPQMKAEGLPPSSRSHEFAALRYLYFGTVADNTLELNMQLRATSTTTRESPEMEFARSAVACVRRRDGISFLRRYSGATPAQKAVMVPCVALMRDEAARAIIRVYLKLETSIAQRLLLVSTREEVFKVLYEQQPELRKANGDAPGDLVKLRVMKR